MRNDEVQEVWRNYWIRDKDKEVFFDRMSETILSEILKNSGDLRDERILEAGCGRGVISAKLAELGADVHLLDSSPEALQIAQKHFASKSLRASFTEGDVLDLPFAQESFGLVWNAGVMEHFENDLQVKAIQGICRILMPGGLFVTFNPYAGALFYAIGKKSAEKRRKWPYGPEFPVRSLRAQCLAAGLSVLKEYPICFKENLSFLSYWSKHLRSVLKLAFRLFSERFLMNMFGGYLLVTVAEKRKK